MVEIMGKQDEHKHGSELKPKLDEDLLVRASVRPAPSLSFTFDLFEFRRHKYHAHHRHTCLASFCSSGNIIAQRHLPRHPLTRTSITLCRTGTLRSISLTQVTTSHAK